MLRRSRQSLAAAALALAALSNVAPLAAQVDTVKGGPKPLFTWRDVTFVGGMIALTGAVSPLDKSIADHLQDSTVQANRFFGNVASFVRTVADPGAVIIGVGLYGIGRIAKNDRMADLGLHGTEALAIGTAIGFLGKGVFGRERPYVERDPDDFAFLRGFKSNTDFKSFPSGHTIAAFASAAAVTSETSRWWPKSRWYVGTVMYGGAALVGVSRMYNNRHWASDVMMGAAIGTLSGLKVVRYHHSHPNNDFDRFLLGGRISTASDGSKILSWSFSTSGIP